MKKILFVFALFFSVQGFAANDMSAAEAAIHNDFQMMRDFRVKEANRLLFNLNEDKKQADEVIGRAHKQNADYDYLVEKALSYRACAEAASKMDDLFQICDKKL